METSQGQGDQPPQMHWKDSGIQPSLPGPLRNNDKTRVKLFPYFTLHHLITYTYLP